MELRSSRSARPTNLGSWIVVCGAVVLGGCACPGPGTGQGSKQPRGAKDRRASTTKSSEPGVGAARAGQSVGPSDALVDPNDRALSGFYRQLRDIGQGQREVVRVIHWGDSHVAGESMTGHLRRLFQQRFGDAGPGFVIAGRPWRSYRQAAVRFGTDKGWRAERFYARYGRRRKRPRDDMLGLGGVSVYASRPASFWVEPRRGRVSSLDVLFLRQPGGGDFRVLADSRTVARVSTAADGKVGGHERIELDRPARRIEIRSGPAEVRLFGVDLRSGGSGLIYDALGINGAAAISQLMWNEALTTEQLALLEPDLVVLAYGSNEVDARSLKRDSYAKGLDTVLKRLRRMSPGAACLLVGPPDQARRDEQGDWVAPEKLPWIISLQRSLALAHGCAFWDQRSAMGGSGAIFRWLDADPPLARTDHVHFRRDGYHRLARALFEDLMHRGNFAPSSPPE